MKTKKRKGVYKESICWDCKNAYASKCEWVRNGKPVWEKASKEKRYSYPDGNINVWIVEECKAAS